MSTSVRIAALMVVFALLNTFVGCSQVFSGSGVQFNISSAWTANKPIVQNKTASYANTTITYGKTIASYTRYDDENKLQAGIAIYTEEYPEEAVENWCKRNSFKREEFAKHVMDSELKKGLEEMKNTHYSSITLGGETGFRFDGLVNNGDAWYYMVTIAAEHNEKIYFIQYMENEASQVKYVKELDAVLQSFKFLE